MGGRKYKAGEIAFSVVLLLIGLVFFFESLSIPSGNQALTTSPRTVPLLLSSLLIATSSITLARAVWAWRHATATGSGVSTKALGYVVMTLLYITGLFFLPFFIVSTVFMICSFLYWGALKPVHGVAYSVVLVAITMWLFARFFYVMF